MKTIVLLLSMLFLYSHSAIAHGLRTFAYFDNNHVYTETSFHDGKAAKNAEVKVFDNKSDALLLTGITDDKGEFSFESPKAQFLKILVRASMGHQSETILEKKQSDNKEKRNDKEPAPAASSPHSHKQITLSKEQLEKIVEEKLDEKLAPLKSLLEQMIRENLKPSLSDIIGGIGYIVGLFFIAAYFYSKKNK